MNSSHHKFSRRSSLILGGSALLGVAACGRQSAEAEKVKAAAPSPEEQLAAGRRQIEEIQKVAKENSDREIKQRETLIATERKTLTDYYTGLIKEYQDKNTALTTQLLALAARAPTSTEEKTKITEAVNPPPAPKPPPSPTNASDDKDQQSNALMSLLLTALAIAFPQMAGVIALFAGASAGLSASERDDYAKHLTTGEPMSDDLNKKVQKDPNLRKIDEAAAAARAKGIVLVKPEQQDRDKAKIVPTPPPPPSSTSTNGAAPPPAATPGATTTP